MYKLECHIFKMIFTSVLQALTYLLNVICKKGEKDSYYYELMFSCTTKQITNFK